MDLYIYKIEDNLWQIVPKDLEDYQKIIQEFDIRDMHFAFHSHSIFVDRRWINEASIRKILK